MHKLAVFVEGQTEQLFVEQFVKEVAGHHNVTVETCKAHGGGRRLPRQVTTLTAADAGGRKYYVLIHDSASDERVVSDIRERYDGLVNAKYSCVLAVRDVYPQARGDIPAMRIAIAGVLPKGNVPVHLVLSVMEIEAWFIGEYTHFAKIDARITLQRASQIIGKDVVTVDVEAIDKPTATLRKIYRLGGRRYYSKKKRRMRRTIAALDFDKVYLELPERIPALKMLCEKIDEFLAAKNL